MLKVMDSTVNMNNKNSKGPPTDMASEQPQRTNLERFSKMVLGDRDLHERLRAADAREFAALAVRLGAERGCVFTEAVVLEELQKKRRVLREKWI